jgi:hypothetical protein
MRKTSLVLCLIATIIALPGCSTNSSDKSDDTTIIPEDSQPVTDSLADDSALASDNDIGSDTEDVDTSGWHHVSELPFVIERPKFGEALSDEEVEAFTRKITGFYKDTAFFDWIWWTAHGLHESYDPEMPDYGLWWQDTQTYKEGDTVRFVHTGGADNLSLRTTKVLNNVIAGYLMTSDMYFGRIVRQYSKGLVALSQGFEWESEDPLVKYLQSRAIFTHDHEYTLEGGRNMKVEYGPIKENEKYDWNAHTLPNDENPHYGAIWVRTMRSKDDVPHMFRSVPMLRRVATQGEHEDVREAAALALEYMEGFAKDIVDSGYQIRTKDKEGTTLVPLIESGAVNDLASFVLFDDIIPNAECTATLSSALVAYGEALDNDCGEFDHNMYEDIATDVHYFNLAIIRFFHLSALANALAVNELEIAEALLKGLVKRADRYMKNPGPIGDDRSYSSATAGWLLAAAASGLPLTSAEARYIVKEYTASADHYATYEAWDPWADSVPDGQFDYKPPRDGPEAPDGTVPRHVRITEMTFALEYCFSPYRAENGARLLDCDIIADPARW